MREDFTKMVETKHFRITCDICGKVQVDSYNGFNNCSICKKLGCRTCVASFYEGGGDRATHFACPVHKEQIRKMFADYDDFINAIPDVDTMIKSLTTLSQDKGFDKE